MPKQVKELPEFKEKFDADEIEAILLAAKDAGLATNRIRDAGKTQIPSGSLTVGAIGPAIESELDELTGHLKLL